MCKTTLFKTKKNSYFEHQQKKNISLGVPDKTILIFFKDFQCFLTSQHTVLYNSDIISWLTVYCITVPKDK
jgi:hypothetical protein